MLRLFFVAWLIGVVGIVMSGQVDEGWLALSGVAGLIGSACAADVAPFALRELAPSSTTTTLELSVPPASSDGWRVQLPGRRDQPHEQCDRRGPSDEVKSHDDGPPWLAVRYPAQEASRTKENASAITLVVIGVVDDS
ncbi:hypothetical protein [Solirubrobacter pauli]|uniref:hypothetical protein n=1 Tax=Solirubrobacter pauli TaxID=166793 RepID=UPI000EB451C4|nr:hypothetical protein [Solirubrobacter pauli]